MLRFQRSFSRSLLQRGTPPNTDLVSDLYVAELKLYKPAPLVEKSGLQETFSLPQPPAKPAVETLGSVKAMEALAEAAWPELLDPIDDTKNYNNEWDFRTDIDDGSLFPKRLVPIDYDGHH